MLKRARNGWSRAKSAVHSARLLQPHMPLAGWGNGDQMVYACNSAYLEIGQGGSSPMRGWGVGVLVPAFLFFVWVGLSVFWYCISQVWDPRPIWQPALEQSLPGIDWVELLLGAPVAFVLAAASGLFAFLLFGMAFLIVTDPTVRLDAKRQRVWMWTGKGPIEMDWASLVPRVESSVASAYATVKLYRGQYAELGSDGEPKVTKGIPHVFQCGQISAAEEGVRPSMEYVRLYMESGPHAVQAPEKLLSHRPRWYAMVNLFGMADDWVRWRENRDRPGVAPAPWFRTVVFVLLFPVFFPMQFTNWLALAVAPKPKWPKELEAMHAADLARAQAEEAARRVADPRLDRAQEAEKPRRKPVIRVNGQIVDGDA